jgi:hypothetical protein
VLTPVQPVQTIFTEPATVKGSGRQSKVTSLPVAGPRAATGGNDPMNAAVQDILNGWGDLAPEDMKRLQLFRPDRLSAALAAVQLPKSSSTETKMRLSELRHYASDLEQRAYAAQVAAAAAAPAVAPEAATAEAAAAPAAQATVPIKQTASIFTGYAAPSPSIASGATVAAPAMPAPATAASTGRDAPAGPASDVAVGAAKNVSPLDDPSSFWADPRPLWEPNPGESLEKVAAPTYHEIDMDPLAAHDIVFGTAAGHGSSHDNGHGDNGNGYKSGLMMDMAPSATTGMPVSTPVVHETPAPPLVQTQPVVKPPYTAEDFFWDDEPVQAISRLSVKVETAEQLLALPASERVDMAAFLPPAELVAAFRATHDPDLKKAVIDTLEHIGSPASLNALGNCFEDGDSDIQTYALAAADRLLGVA